MTKIPTIDGSIVALGEVTMLGTDHDASPYLVARGTGQQLIDLRAYAKSAGLPWLHQLPDQQDDQQRMRIFSHIMTAWRCEGLRQMAQRDQMTELDAWLEGGGL